MATDYSWTEPVTNTKSTYPYNNASETESGHFQEWDDTPGHERIRTQHRTGSFTEMQPDGSVVNKIVGKNYTIVAKDNNVLIQGVCNITVQGDSVLNVQGDCISRVRGNESKLVEGDYELLVKGRMRLNGADIGINNVSPMGKINMVAAMGVELQADLIAHGKVQADSISSVNEVTAGTGIHAGVIGSTNPVAGITTLGGINAGMVGPTVPGMVYAPMSISSVFSFSPFVLDWTGGLPAARLIYDSHSHIGNLGYPVAPAVPQMLLP